jgi:hypothetical protein
MDSFFGFMSSSIILSGPLASSFNHGCCRASDRKVNTRGPAHSAPGAVETEGNDVVCS